MRWITGLGAKSSEPDTAVPQSAVQREDGSVLIEGTVAQGSWSLTLALGTVNDTAASPSASERATDAASMLQFDLAVHMAVRHLTNAAHLSRG